MKQNIINNSILSDADFSIFKKFAAMFLLAAVPLTVQAQFKGIKECPPPGCGSQSTNRETPQSGNTSRALGALQELQRMNAERSAMDRDASTRDLEQAQEELRQAADRSREADARGRIEAAKNRNDPSLNPFGPRVSRGDATTTAPSSEGSQPAVNPERVNTAQNIEGQPCTWFVVKDVETCKSRSCTYSDGETVALGSSAYVCRGSRWTRIRDCTQSPTNQQKNECVRDIVSQHGLPGSKEGAAVKIFQQD